MNKQPNEIWQEYVQGNDYHYALGLFDTIEQNQKFINGDQWSGVAAPDIEKPVINILRPAVDWFNSMLVSDDIGVTCDLEDQDTLTKQAIEHIVTKSIEDVFEQTKYKPKLRIFVRNAAIDGGSYKHWWFNSKKNTDKELIGAIDMEIIDNTNIIFGNPAEIEVEKQPYIIIVSKLPTDQVKDMVSKAMQEGVTANDENLTEVENLARASNKYTTVLTKLWKENDTVHYMKTTEKVIIKPDTNLGAKLYPISKMNWKTMKNCYQGISPITEVIPNQIMINKFYMMINEFTKKMAFPKMLYNKALLSGWSNKVEALGIDGDPRIAVASATPEVNMSEQVFRYVDTLIDQTKQTLGIYDVALGNVQPDNTSAIIALQKTAAQPLELQRLELYNSTEEDVRIIVELMAKHYGKRTVRIETEAGEGDMEFDYSDLSYEAFKMNVEVGQSYYWSQVTAIQTLDNMFDKGIIPDAITYLEQLPTGTIKNRGDIIEAIRKKQEQDLMAQQAAMIPQQAPVMPGSPTGQFPQ